jgi:hypothetical protein
MKHLVTVAFLIAAVVFAIAGSASGFALFLLIGLLCEGVFWYRLLKKKPKRASTA